MPRQSRLDAPGTLHHVMGRGIEGSTIFRNEADRVDFLDRVAELCDQEAWIVYAWALMSNHFHLLVKTGKRPLAGSMRRLLTGYSINFNLRHRRYGHLFQNRYKSIVCEEDPYLLELTRYIHLNPVRAGVVKDLLALARYPWTGHSVLVGKVRRSWQDTRRVLSYFGRKRREAVAEYERFVAGGVAQGRRPELVGGGLIRSLGGWSQVLSFRRQGIQVATDERILGSGGFVESLLDEVDEQERQTLRLRRKFADLEALSRAVAEGEGITEEQLRSGRRTGKISRARRLFCQLTVGRLGLAGAHVARFLGVSTSAVVKAAHSNPLPDILRYL